MESQNIPTSKRNSVLSRWLPMAILVSLLLHIAFLWWTRGITWRSTAPAPPPAQQQVRPFRLVKPVALPSPQQSSPDKERQKVSLPKQSLSLPVEKMEPKLDVGTLPSENLNSLPKISQTLLQENPGTVGSSLNPLIQKTISEGVQKEQFIQNLSKSSTNPLVDLLQSSAAGNPTEIATSGRQPGSVPQGFSDLDALLSQTGPLKSETAPILMPTDVLFDYDNAELRAQAVDSLRKLGILIQRNPQATFLIEGHTDSFGSANYNMDLSLRRAEAVKNWLLQTMGIPSTRIETKGFGKSRLLVPASGTIEQQQINRRVEIVIHVPKHS